MSKPDTPPDATPVSRPPDLRPIGPHDLRLMRELLAVFAAAFDDPEHYLAHPPDDAYLARLLGREHFIALAALHDGAVVGGLTAYELQKFEQVRSEIYLYDLAVAAAHRRAGVASALIEALKSVARARGAKVIFVQADTGAEDAPAIALYSKLGVREAVLNFDIDTGDGHAAD